MAELRSIPVIWLLQLSPELVAATFSDLSIEERQNIEHKLLRWLVVHHAAKVIRVAKRLPPADQLELKIAL